MGKWTLDRICEITAPLRDGEADYVKGNRFYHLESLRTMPVARLIGNAGLSFLSKLSTGYWNLFDPTNGFTAIHAAVARRTTGLGKLHPRYFFESDILFGSTRCGRSSWRCRWKPAMAKRRAT